MEKGGHQPRNVGNLRWGWPSRSWHPEPICLLTALFTAGQQALPWRGTGIGHLCVYQSPPLALLGSRLHVLSSCTLSMAPWVSFWMRTWERELVSWAISPCCCSWSQGYNWHSFTSSSTTRAEVTSTSATTSAGFGVLAGDVIQTLIARVGRQEVY